MVMSDNLQITSNSYICLDQLIFYLCIFTIETQELANISESNFYLTRQHNKKLTSFND